MIGAAPCSGADIIGRGTTSSSLTLTEGAIRLTLVRPMATSRLSEYLKANKPQIIEAWVHAVRERFGLEPATKPLLINDLPEFLDELERSLGGRRDSLVSYDGAREHGRQRLELGVDIGQLVQEFSLVGETIVRLAGRDGLSLIPEEFVLLLRLIGKGSSQAVAEYVQLRDEQISDQAAEHFSFIAHEIRTPLHTARLAARLLQEEVGDRAKNHQRLHRAHMRLSELVDNAILEARLYGKPRLRLARVDLRELTEEVVDELYPQADERGIRLDTRIEHAHVDVDRKIVYSALVNLLGNAIKFTRDDGHVTLRLAVDGRVASFEVEDECGGLKESALKQLFEPFAQSGENKSGFGLGLMIVRASADAHGGSVHAKNLPGKGCCFTLTLPLSPRTPD